MWPIFCLTPVYCIYTRFPDNVTRNRINFEMHKLLHLQFPAKCISISTFVVLGTKILVWLEYFTSMFSWNVCEKCAWIALESLISDPGANNTKSCRTATCVIFEGDVCVKLSKGLLVIGGVYPGEVTSSWQSIFSFFLFFFFIKSSSNTKLQCMPLSYEMVKHFCGLAKYSVFILTICSTGNSGNCWPCCSSIWSLQKQFLM